MFADQLSTTLSTTQTSTWLASGLALVMGLALIAVVGFAPLAEIHNAAHDTRHAAAFPCH